MILYSLETTVFYLPYLIVFAVAINLWNEINTYIKISKLEFPNEIKACGHAYFFAIRSASLFCFLTMTALSLSLAWNLADHFDKNFIGLLIFLSVFMSGMMLGVSIIGLVNIHLLDHSETAKLLLASNAKLTKTASMLTNHQKHIIILNKKEEFWSDIKTNFWKYRVEKNS
jgi:hypothetical protein